MGEIMSYTQGMMPAPPARPKSRKAFWAVTFAGIAASFFICAGVTTALTSSTPASDRTALAAPAADTAQIGSPDDTVSPKIPDTLTPADVSLKVKIKSKECFGSAGCNVQFSIGLTLKKDPISAAPCDITYEVRGLEDPQIGTLTVDDQGMYEQDGFQFGSTSSSKRALTAKVTEVSC